MLHNFSELTARVDKKVKRTVTVVMADDTNIIKAIEKLRLLELIHPVLIGNTKKIISIFKELHLDKNNYELLPAKNEQLALNQTIKLYQQGKTDILMKGLCSSAGFLHSILDKNNELRSNKILSHLAIFESKQYHKLFMMSDAAINIAPNLDTKIGITGNAIIALNKLGYKRPKVALISAIEKVNIDGMPSSVEAAIISKMGERGQIGEAIIDGPLAVDIALSREACEVKKLKSPVGGDADILIVPNIETGNAFYKLLTVLEKVEAAGVVLGAKIPVVLTSRADSEESKFLSLITALTIY